MFVCHFSHFVVYKYPLNKLHTLNTGHNYKVFICNYNQTRLYCTPTLDWLFVELCLTNLVPLRLPYTNGKQGEGKRFRND